MRPCCRWTTSAWTSLPRRGNNYADRDIRTLVEGYPELRAACDTNARGLRRLFGLADLGSALRRLPRRLREVVLLHGQLGLSQRETAERLGVSQTEVSRRYQRGLEAISFYMNGGRY